MMSKMLSNAERPSDDVGNDVTETSQRSPEERRRVCLGMNEKLMRLLGVCPERDPPWTAKDHILHTLPRIIAVKTIYYEALQCVNLYLAVGNPFKIIEHAVGAEFAININMKYYVLFSRRREIRGLVDFLVEMHERDDVADERVKKIRDETDVLTKFFGTYGQKFVSIIVGVAFFPAMYIDIVTRKMAYMNWFPYDVNPSPWFEITCLVEGIFAVIGIASMFVADTTLALLIVHIVHQFKMLNYKLEHIHDVVLSKMKKKAPKNYISTRLDLRTRAKGFKTTKHDERIDVAQLILQEVTVVCEVESVKDHKKKAVKRSNAMALISHKYKMKSDKSKFQAEFKKKMEECLHCCVVQHQTLIRLTGELNHAFKHLLTNQVLFNLFLGVCWLFIASQSATITPKFLLSMAAFLSGLMEIAVFSWLADMITAESVRVREAAYACDWLDASEAFKSSLRIIMSRSQQALYIRAAGIPLSRKAAKTVCRAAYYLNMFLNRMYYGTKINDGFK